MIRTLAALILLAATPADDAKPGPGYATAAAPILEKYCAGCHNDDDREGDFSLESLASLREGTPSGPALKPGDGASSRIIRLMTGQARPLMPPKDRPRPSEAEIAAVKAWIDAGALGSNAEPADRLALVVPKITPLSATRPVTALDASRDGRWLALARYGTVEIREASDQAGRPWKLLEGFPGKVTSVRFAPDGRRLVAASGVAGLGGVATLWDAEDGSQIRQFAGHRDLISDAELSPDGKVLATCGYDRTIRLWDTDSGRPLRDLTGHNGAVYDVAFSPDGRFLVSASADDTCKVWRVADGARLDTLTQPLKEEYACAFSPDGRRIVAAGADNSIRVWDFVATDKPRVNPMILARFAHEGPIVRLAFTPDGSRLVTTAEDRTVKVWDASDYSEIAPGEHQPDVASALAIAGDGRSFRVGRMDGSIATYPIPAPRPKAADAPSAPSPFAIAPGEPVEPRSTSEREPNGSPAEANDIELPAAVAGVIEGRHGGVADTDLFRFAAKAGEEWVVEVEAERAGSKLDSFVEILDDQGRRIERVKLQAVRDSYFTFRGKDDAAATDFRLFNQDELHLDEYLYANGEVAKLWLYPRGPDSGFVVYPGDGKRWGYFDTTPLAHALGEPCYIVRAHPPGADLVPNGLPVFTIYHDNDDESRRELGKDSKLTLVAPRDGRYLVRVRDVRGVEGADFRYTLRVRPGHPGYQVELKEAGTTIGRGASKGFRVRAKRLDGFDGPIRVAVEGLPPGFSATSPVVIEEGQVEAMGVISTRPDAAPPSPELAGAARLTASATVRGREVTHDVGPLGAIKLDEDPKLLLKVEAADEGPRPVREPSDGPLEFEISPGQTILLKVKVERRGHVGQVPLGNEGAGRNLPFGVIVDNLGLNGLLITETQDERTFFITADATTRPQSRPFHLKTTAAGGQASPPVILHVR